MINSSTVVDETMRLSVSFLVAYLVCRVYAGGLAGKLYHVGMLLRISPQLMSDDIRWL